MPYAIYGIKKYLFIKEIPVQDLDRVIMRTEKNSALGGNELNVSTTVFCGFVSTYRKYLLTASTISSVPTDDEATDNLLAKF